MPLHDAYSIINGRLLSRLLAGVLCLVFGAGCGIDASDESAGSQSSPLCKSGELTSDATGPVTGSVTLTAGAASCAAGETPEYRFVYRRDGTTALVELQNWSPTGSVTWNTTGLPSGSYHVIVYVRSAGSIKQSYGSLQLLVGHVCNTVSLSSDVASPQSVGAVLGLTAASTCTGGTPEYQFTAKPRVGSSVVIQDWSSSAGASWNTQGLAAGPYTIYVSTRASGNLVFDAQGLLAFRLGETCATPTLTTTPSSPGELGADVVLSASTTCTGAATPQFRFSYRPSAAKSYALLQDWGGAASTTWHTTGLPADNYGIMVETRSDDYAGPSQARRQATFVLGPSCNAVTLIGSPKSPPPLGALLTFTANATCSSGSPEYRFSARSPGSTTYDEFRGWGANTASFPTAGLAGGDYAFKVETRAVGSIVRYQAYRALAYDLGGVCNKVTFATTPPSPSLPGTSVSLSASATCVNGGTPEYQFAARAVGTTAWTTLRDWGSASAVWDTGQAPWNSFGDYQLRVSARGQGQLGPAESNRVLPYSLTSGCVESSTYDLTINGSYTELLEDQQCKAVPGSYQRVLHAAVVGDAVQVTDEGFAGSYPIVARTAAGFTARAGGDGFDCGWFLPGGNNSGDVTLQFDCASARATFNATCVSDFPANGCYPDYTETAAGSGWRNVACQPGYQSSQAKCVDIDECAGPACSGAETCTNTPGSFSCSCDAPARVCDGVCVKTDTDVDNCGACGNSCADGQVCSSGACVTQCPSGYTNSGGTCVDIDECVAGTPPCDPNATCTNSPGSYSCACKAGFTGNGVTCTDIDECASQPCGGAATCTNTPGSYVCSCNAPAMICQARCVNTATDRANCGGCGVTCGASASCIGGSCVTPAWKQVVVLANAVCGLHGDGTAACWPYFFNLFYPTPSGTFSTISGANGHLCGLRTDSTVACWGDNLNGEATPPNGTFTAVASGFISSCGIRPGGALECWGSSRYGLTTPPAGTFSAVSIGAYQACAIRTDGTVACWGDDRSTAPSGTFTAVSTGIFYVCGLRSDGSLACWGGPYGPEPIGKFSMISVGDRTACAVRTDGTIACWGDNSHGQATPPSGTFSSVSTEIWGTCGVRTDGTIACWGDKSGPP